MPSVTYRSPRREAGGGLWPELADELAAELTRELPGNRRALVRAYATGTLDRVAREAHQLRGAAAVCGLEALAEAAANLEAAAGRGHRHHAKRGLRRVCREIHRLCTTSAVPR